MDFAFVWPDNRRLDRLVDRTADDIRTRRALDQKPCLRGFAETSYQAKSWNTDRRACARIEATTKGLDIRFVVTSIETGSAVVNVTSAERARIRAVVANRNSPQKHVWRANIILLTADGLGTN